MQYNITSNFTKISETSGTIQNNSSVYDVEISDRPTAGSGILLHPLNKFTFNNQTLYVRCVAGGWAAINVVPFIVDGGSVISSSGSSTTGDQSFSQADLDYIFG